MLYRLIHTNTVPLMSGNSLWKIFASFQERHTNISWSSNLQLSTVAIHLYEPWSKRGFCPYSEIHNVGMMSWGLCATTQYFTFPGIALQQPHISYPTIYLSLRSQYIFFFNFRVLGLNGFAHWPYLNLLFLGFLPFALPNLLEVYGKVQTVA
jgi:hypothetical protein